MSKDVCNARAMIQIALSLNFKPNKTNKLDGPAERETKNANKIDRPVFVKKFEHRVCNFLTYWNIILFVRIKNCAGRRKFEHGQFMLASIFLMNSKLA